MSATDAIELGGLLLATWVVGFGCGFIVVWFRKFFEQV